MSYFCLKDTIQETSAWIGACLNLYFFITPITPYINVVKGKLNYDDTPGRYVTVIYVNSICWYTYAELIFSDQLRLSYIIGAIITLILMLIYLFYEVKKYLFDSILNICIIITGTYSLYVGLTLILDDDILAGKFCVVSHMVYLYYPSQVIYKVIKNKNYNLIDIRGAYLAFVTGVLWVVYGVLISEQYVVFPHVLQVIISLIQIFIFKRYKKKYPSFGLKEVSTIGIQSKEEEEIKKEDEMLKEKDEGIKSNFEDRPVQILERDS